MKDREAGISDYQRGLRAKRNGFTLIELSIAGVILCVIITALFMSLNVGESSISLGLAKVDLHAKVRNVMDWIVRDVRQTNLAEIDTNSPSQYYIKFRKVTGIDNLTGSYTLSPECIEYSYNSVSSELSRNEINFSDGVLLQTLVFSNITQSPFYADTGVPLAQAPNPGNILSAKKLVIIVAGQSRLRNGLTFDFSLTEEAKVRNP